MNFEEFRARNNVHDLKVIEFEVLLAKKRRLDLENDGLEKDNILKDLLNEGLQKDNVLKDLIIKKKEQAPVLRKKI